MNTTGLIGVIIIVAVALGMLWLARFLNRRDQSK